MIKNEINKIKFHQNLPISNPLQYPKSIVGYIKNIPNLDLRSKLNKIYKNYNNKLKIHEYHLVENSPWPIYITISILSILINIILLLNNNENKYIKILLILSLISLFLCLFNWFYEIHIEGTLEGYHTERVQKGLIIGFILFIISEICIFGTLFFAFFYNSLIPSIEISSIYPPIGIESINPKTLPLLNTIILFISGITSTCSLNLLISNNFKNKIIKLENLKNVRKEKLLELYDSRYNNFNIPKSKSFYSFFNQINNKNSIFYLLITIILGVLFTYFQYLEYSYSSFSLSDSIFGSNFFILTGFHGVHVIFGIIFLFIALIRLILNHYNTENHLNLIFANIYWHFVDYVWIILFIFLYCWAN